MRRHASCQADEVGFILIRQHPRNFVSIHSRPQKYCRFRGDTIRSKNAAPRLALLRARIHLIRCIHFSAVQSGHANSRSPTSYWYFHNQCDVCPVNEISIIDKVPDNQLSSFPTVEKVINQYLARGWIGWVNLEIIVGRERALSTSSLQLVTVIYAKGIESVKFRPQPKFEARQRRQTFIWWRV